MIDRQPLLQQLRDNGLTSWAERLPEQLDRLFTEQAHGDLPRWRATLAELPALAADRVTLDSDTLQVSSKQQLEPALRTQLEQLLRTLHPWRKGPYTIHGIHIDTEWRSDWKWRRLADQITPLSGRRVLDIGCGNGYHCWRMAGAGARLVVGIDPTQLYLAQFLAIRHFLGRQWPVHLLPFGIEALPANLRSFDSCFSMGVLYHRRSPIDHLLELKGTLRQGGELILETLVIEGGEGEVLLPPGRYAKMRNVWFIPTPTTLIGWLQRCGFQNVRLIDVTRTTRGEQRTSDWMQFESLSDFLDPEDSRRTIEGHPAPCRAIIVATNGAS